MTTLLGRDMDIAVIDTLLGAVGGDDALLLTGQPGVGKSALLDVSAQRARRYGYRVIRAAGTRLTTNVMYSVLSDVVRPGGDTLAALSGPLRDALQVVLGLGPGDTPTPLHACNAVLAALAAQTTRHPIAVIIDDLQWIDPASALVLSFVGRRAGAHRLKFLAATDTVTGFWDGTRLPQHRITALADTAAAELVESHFPGLDVRTQRRLLAEAQGNPLTLLELGRWTAGVGESAALATTGRWPALNEPLASMYAERIRALPAATREVLLLAALNSGGELSILGIAAPGGVLSTLAPAERDGLVTIRTDGHTVDFCHPMVRTTVIGLAHDLERRRAHYALASALSGHPDREATHLAEATIGPDAHVAASLETAAHRSMATGDSLRALDLMIRSSRISAGSADRSRRMVYAATLRADVTGDLRAASETLAVALEDEPALTDSLAATVAAAHILLNAECDVDSAYGLLVAALTKHPGARDPADAAVLDALHSLIVICWMRNRGENDWEPVDTAMAKMLPEPPVLLRLCRFGFGDPVRMNPALLCRVEAAVGELSGEYNPVEVIRTHIACVYLDRLPQCREALRRVVRDGRDGGAVALALSALVGSAVDDWHTGRWDEARAEVAEGVALSTRHGYRRYSFVLGDYIGALVATARGEAETSAAAAASLSEMASVTGAGIAATFAHHLRTLSASADGDFDRAYQHASAISTAGQLAPDNPHALWVFFDLVEAAVKTNRAEQARKHVDAMRQANIAELSSRLALIFTACAAMAGPDDGARASFEEALAIPGATRWQFDYARVQLAHAEHLRGMQSTAEASRHFNAALRTFEGLGAEPWVARATRGLRATHSTTYSWRGPAGPHLSARDREIAALAAVGLTNREIGERLHISHRTVGGHLYRIFPLLGVTSRAALHEALDRLTNEQPQT